MRADISLGPPSAVPGRHVGSGRPALYEPQERLLEVLGACHTAHRGYRAVGHHPALPQQDEAVTVSGLVHHVAGHEQCAAAAGEVVEALPELLAQQRVLAYRGLVEDQQLRPAEQGAGQGGPAVLAARQRPDELAGRRGQADVPDDPGHVGVIGACVQGGEVPDVLPDREVGVNARRLGDIADTAAQPGGTGRLAQYLQVPGAELLDPHDGPQQRGLAPAAGPDEAGDGAPGDGRADAVEHPLAPSVHDQVRGPYHHVGDRCRHLYARYRHVRGL